MGFTDLKVLYEVFEGDRDKIRMAIKSLDRGYVTIDELTSQECFRNGDYYYSDEDYVVGSHGYILDKNSAYWCEGNEEYYDENDMVTVYLYRSEQMYSREYAEQNNDWHEFGDCFYDQDALSYHDLVYVEDVGEIWHDCDAYYHDDDGCYYSYREEREEYARDYHNGSYQSVNFDNKSKYKIGYEIEKEDADVLQSIDIDEFENDTNGDWRKEKDGSLCDERGYELISPTFELNIDKIFEHIESNSILVNHINAETSRSCGGHIHLSEDNLSGEQLFDKVKGYTPLFYALYYGRVDKTYCKGKANADLKCDNEKYQAIKIHSNRIEFRIISAVPNVNTLKWRTKLLMMILQNPTNDIIKAYYNVDTKFTKLLKQTYTDDKLVELKERFVKFTRQFEGLDIK